MASLQLLDLHKSFGTTEVLKGINLDVADGEFIVFVGPSGCGKSTLLRCIAGLEDISSGELRLDGQRMNEVAPAQRGLAMVFQSYALYPHMSVRDNMGFGLRMAGQTRAQIATAVNEVAQTLQLTPLLDRRPAQLSGGQRQRVAIGRALVRRPGLFLFDEPLSNLDASLRSQMRVELARLHAQLGTTMVHVTHDQAEAMTLADRIVVFNQGRIEQVGTPLALYHRPVNRFVASFLGSPQINLLSTQVLGQQAGQLQLSLGHGDALISLPGTWEHRATGEALTLGLRPEHCSIDPQICAQPATLAVKVQVLEHLGDVAYVHTSTAQGQTVVARAAPDCALSAGDNVTLFFDPARALVFDAQGTTVDTTP